MKGSGLVTNGQWLVKTGEKTAASYWPLSFRHLAVIVLCLCLLPAVASGMRQGREGEARYENEGEALLDRWQAAAALEWVEAKLAAEPMQPAWRFLYGRALFYQGRYQEALDTFDALLDVLPHPSFQAFRDFVAATQQSTADLELLETPNFLIYIDPQRDAALMPYVADVLERSYQRLGGYFQFFPREKIRVEIFPTASTFHPASSLSARDIEVSGAIGICKFNKIMLLSPRNLARGYRWTDSLSHEYVHYILVQLSHNRAPIWLHEGMARYFETAWRLPQPSWLNRRTESLLAHALANNSFVGFKNMEPSLVKLETTYQVQLGYAEAASAIDFIVNRLGYEGLPLLLQELQQAPQGEGAAEVVARLIGLEFHAFEKEWRRFLEARGLKAHDGVRMPRFDLKQNGKTAAADLRREISSGTARMHSRLGDRLRRRGRLPAAAMEYRRALEQEPQSPFLLNKLATALMAQGRRQQALRHLLRASELETDYVTTYTNLGGLYIVLEEFERACEALSQATQINPFDPTIHLHLATCHAQLGDADKAQQERQLFEQLEGSL